MNKLAIIGLGTISKHYLEGIKENNFFDDIVVMDKNKASKSKKLFKNYKFYSNFDSLVKKEKPNWVLISTPPKTHYELAKKAILNNINILIEKPCFLNKQQFDEIEKLAKEKNIKIFVMFHWQYGEEVKQLLLDKRFNPKKIKSIETTVFDPYCNKYGMIKRRKLGLEGALIDSGVNILSLIKKFLPFNDFQILKTTNVYNNLTHKDLITRTKVELLIDNVKVNFFIDWKRYNCKDFKFTKIKLDDKEIIINHSMQYYQIDNVKYVFDDKIRLTRHYYNLFTSFSGESNIDEARKIHEALYSIYNSTKYVSTFSHKTIIQKIYYFFKSSCRKRNIIVLIFSALMMGGILSMAFIPQVKSIGDNLVLSTIFGTIFGILFSLCGVTFFKTFLNMFEDVNKVSLDDNELSKIYDPLYSKNVEFNNTITRIYYNPLLINRDATNDYHFDCDFNEDFNLTDIISNNSLSIYGAHASSNKAFDDMVRLYDYDEKNKIFYLRKTNYFNHLITNRAIDYKIDDKYTLRQIYEHGPHISSLKESKFSNHIGINALVFTNDNHLFLPKRSKTATISKNKVTSSVACGLRLKDLKDGTCDADYLFNKIIYNKMINRLTLNEFEFQNNGEDISIEFLGFGQNIYEGGKPQLYFKVILNNVTHEMAMDYSNKIYDAFIDRGKLDFDPQLYLINFATLSFAKNKIKCKGYAVYKRNGKKGCNCKKQHKEKPLKFAFEKSFIANLWHMKELEK